MAKIDFQHFKIYTTVNRKTVQTVDAREKFADMVYNNVNGIRSHALALKIYGSEGETWYTDAEARLIATVANRLCVPGFIDGLNEQLNNNDNKTERP